MNIENVIKLRATLRIVQERRPERFDMGQFLRVYNGEGVEPDPTECGTVACIGGWAFMLQLPPGADVKDPNLYAYLERDAADWLGLDQYEANHWFYGGWARWSDGDYRGLSDLTIDHALTFLDEVIATGNPRCTVVLTAPSEDE